MLLLSPSLLDQSFPKTTDELKRVSIALGEIDAFLRAEDVVLVNIDIFSLFVEEFYWEKAETHSQLMDIITVLSEWLLRSPSFVKTVCLDEVSANQSHPLPSNIADSACVTIWAEQSAKLLIAHDRAMEDGRFFLGIACECAFASEKIGQLENPQHLRAFPLVGPTSWQTLDSCFEWVLPKDLHNKSVSFRDAKKNIGVLGGAVSNPSSGSHYKVDFVGARRSWSLDKNVDPQPDRFLSELETMVDLPFDVIKYVLLNGKFPEKEYRLRKYFAD